MARCKQAVPKSVLKGMHNDGDLRQGSCTMARNLRPITVVPPWRTKISIPLPPRRMRHMVRKGAGHKSQFLYEGRQVFRIIGEVLNANQVSLNSLRVLEFGVGCGRVARHFTASQHSSFVGTDVDSKLIAWCCSKLATADKRFSFFTNAYKPPLELQDESVDFAFSISVFTHLSAADQIRWFDEIHRVLVHDGHFLVTFIEEQPGCLTSGVETQIRNDQKITRRWLGQNGAPTSYITTRSSLDWFTDKAERMFETIDVRPLAVRNKQSVVLFRKRASVTHR